MARTFEARNYVAEVELVRYVFVMKLRQSYQVRPKKSREMTESRAELCDLTKKIARKSISGARIWFGKFTR